MGLLRRPHQLPEVGQLGGLDAENHVAAHSGAQIFGRGRSRALERAGDLSLESLPLESPPKRPFGAWRSPRSDAALVTGGVMTAWIEEKGIGKIWEKLMKMSPRGFP